MNAATVNLISTGLVGGSGGWPTLQPPLAPPLDINQWQSGLPAIFFNKNRIIMFGLHKSQTHKKLSELQI